MVNFNLNIQAHLFIGSYSNLNMQTINLLKTILCKKTCNSCNVCTQIEKKSHEQITWLKPEKQYSLDQIDTIIQNISLTPDKQKKYFIILEHAELLTIACSNRLLKSIEEPPAGYYFIFLTERPQIILPTILSRCVSTYFDLKDKDDLTTISHELELSDIGKYFITSNSDPVEFLKTIDKSSINEHESIELIDKLINFWSKKSKNALIILNQNDFQKIEKRLEILHKAFQMSPMPGSSKIFWKNLFINLT